MYHEVELFVKDVESVNNPVGKPRLPPCLSLQEGPESPGREEGLPGGQKSLWLPSPTGHRQLLPGRLVLGILTFKGLVQERALPRSLDGCTWRTSPSWS